jgi:Uma2 family endonuclease
MHPPTSARSLPHLRAPRALEFRVEAEVPESKRHLLLRTLLFRILTRAYEGHACIGSDQFVYWNAADPTRCLAPDAFLRFGAPDEEFDTWKTWERGAPELCVEITSRSDRADPDWEQKLTGYRELGVVELVRFDPPTGRLRVWDRLDDDLVERAIEGETSPSLVTGATWVVTDVAGKSALRLASDAGGTMLLPTPEEAEAEGREAAEKRVAELEALLRRNSKP